MGERARRVVMNESSSRSRKDVASWRTAHEDGRDIAEARGVEEWQEAEIEWFA